MAQFQCSFSACLQVLLGLAVRGIDVAGSFNGSLKTRFQCHQRFSIGSIVLVQNAL